jgi:hypothetical protein
VSGELNAVSVVDEQVCLDILVLLYKNLSGDPASSGVDRAIVQATLNIPQLDMDTNISYLEDKALVTLSRTGSSYWTFAKITGEGIDVIENKERYKDKFPFTQATSQIPQEGERKKVFQTTQPQVNFAQQVTDAFKQASNQVLSAKISTGDKVKIDKQLKALEKELLKAKRADLGAIQKDWEWVKKNAAWASPTVAGVVLEGVKLVLDLP